jgi:ferredoxin-thioredoxin reductase catalytic chain
MDAKGLFEQLKRIQEAKGYFFNRDMDKTMFLIEGLITNRERYGYMCCPCRLAKDDVDADRDIICPCDYREPDVKEFGSCYCGLYVSSEWNEGKVDHLYVPERRPLEKC